MPTKTSSISEVRPSDSSLPSPLQARSRWARPLTGLKTTKHTLAQVQRRSADLQSAVSPICNRQTPESARELWNFGALAECNSAIQQIANLRYDTRRTY